jgi:hypothetical protein
MLDSTSIQKRVFIVGDGSLFDEGLTKLVRYGTTLRVSHVVYSNEIAFLNMIKRDQPDMILLCESGALDTEQILDAISINVLMIGLCIFVVHLSNFTIDAYERPDAIAETQSFQRRTIVAKTGNDLISILTRKHYGPR